MVSKMVSEIEEGWEGILSQKQHGEIFEDIWRGFQNGLWK